MSATTLQMRGGSWALLDWDSYRPESTSGTRPMLPSPVWAPCLDNQGHIWSNPAGPLRPSRCLFCRVVRPDYPEER